MDETLARLAGFVKRPDTHLACAAAVVLAELAPREAAVTEALVAALGKSDAARRPFLIEALGRTGTPRAAEALMPLIRAGGPSGDEALRAVAHAGAGALKPLVALLKDASPQMRPKLAEAIARTGEGQGFAALFAELRAGDERAVQAVAEGVRRALPGLSGKGREALLKQILKALETQAFVSHEPACLAALELAGALARAEALGALMPHATRPVSPVARRAALRAVGKLNLTPEKRASLAGRLLPLLQEADYVHCGEPALAALQGAALTPEHRVALQKLVSSPHGPVREFAMKALAHLGSTRGLADLLACLDDSDPGVVADALNALAQIAGAAAPLAERLLKQHDGEGSRRLARALVPHAADVPGRIRGALARAYVDLAIGRAEPGDQRSQDERRGALLSVLRAAGTAEVAELALQEAGRLRAAGEPLRALALLKSVSGITGWSDSHGLEQALAGLAATPLNLTRAARLNDPHLRLIEEAVGSGRMDPKRLARELLKDKTLSRGAVYYIGHHFAEKVLAEREFGRQILTALAANPRTEEGRQAKEKLVLEGLVRATGRTQAGLLEERSKALMAAADMAAQAREEEEREEKERLAKEKRAAKRAAANARKGSGAKAKRRSP
jgi:HEAT repeat protein